MQYLGIIKDSLGVNDCLSIYIYEKDKLSRILEGIKASNLNLEENIDIFLTEGMKNNSLMSESNYSTMSQDYNNLYIPIGLNQQKIEDKITFFHRLDNYLKVHHKTKKMLQNQR